MKRTTWSSGLLVTADGVGVVAHAGSVATRLLADRTGLAGERSEAMVRRSFVPVHDRGRVLADVRRIRGPEAAQTTGADRRPPG